MTKTEALTRAAAARHASKVAHTSAALYATAFGGADPLTQQALQDGDVAAEAAAKWERVATWHPAQRMAALRKGTLPPFLFRY